jgi:glucokinase
VHVLAIDIGGTKTSAAIVANGAIIESVTWPSPTDATSLQASIRMQVRALTGIETAQACGIGFGGQFDFDNQRVVRSVHVPGWDGFPLSAWAEQEFAIPAIADNDANVGALGESTAGAGQDASIAVYLTISTGIGGAIVVDGALQRGAHSLAAEFGHLTLDPNGPECGCGLHGCAERLLSGLWLQRDHGAEPEILFTDAQFTHAYAERLATLLRQITMVVDPDCFILGGGIGASVSNLAQRTQAALADQLHSWNRPTPQVRTAALGRNSVLIGAAQLAKERYGSA